MSMRCTIRTKLQCLEECISYSQRCLKSVLSSATISSCSQKLYHLPSISNFPRWCDSIHHFSLHHPHSHAATPHRSLYHFTYQLSRDFPAFTGLRMKAELLTCSNRQGTRLTKTGKGCGDTTLQYAGHLAHATNEQLGGHKSSFTDLATPFQHYHNNTNAISFVGLYNGGISSRLRLPPPGEGKRYLALERFKGSQGMSYSFCY